MLILWITRNYAIVTSRYTHSQIAWKQINHLSSNKGREDSFMHLKENPDATEWRGRHRIFFPPPKGNIYLWSLGTSTWPHATFLTFLLNTTWIQCTLCPGATFCPILHKGPFVQWLFKVSSVKMVNGFLVAPAVADHWLHFTSVPLFVTLTFGELRSTLSTLCRKPAASLAK